MPVPEPLRPAAPYRAQVTLRWSDMDAYGHVNNVQFLRLLEQARIIGFREWFAGGTPIVDAGIVVSRHEIEYRAPLTYRHEPVEVAMWVTDLRGAGFDLGYAVREPKGGAERLYAVAQTGLVRYDFETSRPRRLSVQDDEVLRAHLGEPVRFRWQRCG